MRSKVKDLDNKLTGLMRACITGNYALGGANVWGVIPIDTVIVDADACFDKVNHWYVAPVDGIYAVSAKMSIPGLDANWAALLMAGVAKNGNIVTVGARNEGIDQQGSIEAFCSDVIPFIKGDRITAMYYCNAGGWAFTAGTSGGGNNYLSVYRVG